MPPPLRSRIGGGFWTTLVVLSAAFLSSSTVALQRVSVKESLLDSSLKKLEFCADDVALALTVGRRLWRSLDAGVSWSEVKFDKDKFEGAILSLDADGAWQGAGAALEPGFRDLETSPADRNVATML